MWSQKHKKCVRCGTTKVKHVARGLCVSCYNKFLRIRHRGKRTTRGLASKKLTKEYLYSEYIEKKKSLRDIAKECYCSPQYVYQRIVAYDIPTRDKESARSLAISREKLKFHLIDYEGKRYTSILGEGRVNDSFFSKWSPEMAYVLGIVFTDGNIQPGKKRDPSGKSKHMSALLTIAQKEKELLEKILKLIHSNARIYFRKRKRYGDIIQGEIYYLNIRSNKIYDDLIKLGLSPKKSRIVKFPDIPQEYVRHFIRGCWDGDGSVYFERKRPYILKAHFVSGSREFIKSLENHLKMIGLPERTIYRTKGKRPSYYIRYSGHACKILYHFLYDNVLPTQYLERKYSLFKEYTERNS